MEISTPSAVYKEDNAGMGLGHQSGDLNVSPVADRGTMQEWGEWAQTGRTILAWGRGIGVEISTPSAVNHEDNSGKVTRVEASTCHLLQTGGQCRHGDLNALIPSEDGEDNACMKKRRSGGDLNAVSPAI